MKDDSERLRCSDIADASAKEYYIKLVESDFLKYLNSSLGGLKSKTQSKGDCLRVACFLSFGEEHTLHILNVKLKLNFLLTEITHFQSFIYNLEVHHHAQPGTVLTYIDSCRNASEWLGIGCYLQFQSILSTIRKKFKFANRMR
jgi:hypothetical protein